MKFHTFKWCTAGPGSDYLYKFPCDGKWRLCRFKYSVSWLCIVVHEIDQVTGSNVYPGKSGNKPGKFSLSAVGKSLSNTPLTVSLCSLCPFEDSQSEFVMCWSQFEQLYMIVFS